jgi:hypothetical protein
VRSARTVKKEDWCGLSVHETCDSDAAGKTVIGERKTMMERAVAPQSVRAIFSQLYPMTGCSYWTFSCIFAYILSFPSNSVLAQSLRLFLLDF